MVRQRRSGWRQRRCSSGVVAGSSRLLFGAVLLAAPLLVAGTRAQARENQLAGVRLGRPAEMVTDLFGNPTRTFTGTAVAAGGMGGPGGGAGPMMGGSGPGGMRGPMMGGGPGGPGAMMGPGPMMGGGPGGPGAMMGPGPMMGGGPGGMMGPTGMGPMGGAGASSGLVDQKYEGRIAGMRPEEFVARVSAPEAVNPAIGGEMSSALGPGGPAGPPMGMGPGGMMGGMGAASGGRSSAPPAINWVYERSSDGVTFAFGFTEEGRVSLVCVGDDKPYSVVRGGKRPAYSGAKTAKGIGLGSTFKSVILAYGFPESTEIIGDEVLCKYFDRHGVAFTFRQGLPDPGRMRVSSITIKSPDE